jgi:hypothetical protein
MPVLKSNARNVDGLGYAMPSQFSGVADGLAASPTDAATAIEAAIATGLPLFLDGWYYSSRAISMTNVATTVLGIGSAQCGIVFAPTATNGLSMVKTANPGGYAALYRFKTSGFSLITKAAGGGTGLYIEGYNGAEPAWIFDDVFIACFDNGADFWTKGVSLKNIVGARGGPMWINGKSGTLTAGMDIGIEITNSSNSYLYDFAQVTIKWSDFGVKVTTSSSFNLEGLVFTTPTIVGINEGIYIDASSGSPGYTPPYLFVDGGQFDVGAGSVETDGKRAIYAKNFAQIFLDGCVFYGDQTASTFPLVELENCNTFFVYSCHFIDFQGSPQRIGLRCSGSTFIGYVGPCTWQNLATGVVLAAGTSQITIAPGQVWSTVTDRISNAGSNNIIQSDENVIDLIAGTGSVGVTARGSSTNIDLTLNPKGTGAVSSARPFRSNDGTDSASLEPGLLELQDNGGAAFIDFKVTGDYDARIQQASNGLAFSTGGDGTTAVRLSILSTGHLNPGADAAYDVGSAALQFRNVYALGFVPAGYTDAQLNDVANAVNTANKVIRKTVWNSTQSRLVTAAGATAGSLWVSEGSTRNTPV